MKIGSICSKCCENCLSRLDRNCLFSLVFSISSDGDMNPALLDNKELRKGVIGGYYKMMKKVAEISNQNLVRNSDAYISNGGKIDPDNDFCWTDDSYKQGKERFQLGY